MPTQNDDHAFCVPVVTAGTVHDPFTSVTEFFVAVTAYPPQLVLEESVWRILGANSGLVGLANIKVGLNAASRTMKLIANVAVVVSFFTWFFSFFNL